MSVGMLGFLQSFLQQQQQQQAIDSNSKKDCKKQASRQKFGPFYFVHVLAICSRKQCVICFELFKN